MRFVTAASLFDGHDAAINIMRHILQSMGAEVIHLGYNRSVDEVVTAALQEDAQGISISSYQGGHVEYFKYMVDSLKSRGGENIQVFGGGVIVPSEIRELHAYGITRIYSPEDGQKMGLAGMIWEMVMRCDKDLAGFSPKNFKALQGHGEMNWRALAQLITVLENGKAEASLVDAVRTQAAARKNPRTWHHRHRRRRQIVAHRRTDPSHPPGSGRCLAHRSHQHRPLTPQKRRRAAR